MYRELPWVFYNWEETQLARPRRESDKTQTRGTISQKEPRLAVVRCQGNVPKVGTSMQSFGSRRQSTVVAALPCHDSSGGVRPRLCGSHGRRTGFGAVHVNRHKYAKSMRQKWHCFAVLVQPKTQTQDAVDSQPHT